MVNFGSFIQQVLPIAILYLLIPALLIGLYLVIRAVRKRMNPQANEAKHSPTPTEAVAQPNALDILAQAGAGEDVDLDPLDDVEMPDISSLLGDIAAEQEVAHHNGHITMSTGETVKATSLIDVMRDEATGQLLVKMDGVGYYQLADSPEMKKAFKQVMTELSGVIMQSGQKPTRSAAKPAAKSAAARSAEKPTYDDDLIDELRHQDYGENDYADDNMEDEIGEPDPSMFMASYTPPPPIDSDGHLPGDLPSYKLDDLQVNIESRGAFRKAKVTVEEPPELNIADAIDAYLQHKLRYTPEMDGTRIGIMPSMSGGVRIVVNGQAYEAVDEIAEPRVRAFIQQAIAEWQERQ